MLFVGKVYLRVGSRGKASEMLVCRVDILEERVNSDKALELISSHMIFIQIHQ